MHLDRRSVLKGAGAGGAALLAPSSVRASVDDDLDRSSDVPRDVIVVFESTEAVDRLAELDLADGYHAFDALPIGYTRLTGPQIERVAHWPGVVGVEANRELEYHNADARDVTGADTVQTELFYTGSTVHAAVIDSGIDGDHPDFANSLRHNYRFLNPLDSENAMWTDVGPVDSGGGHGTHVSGSLAGEGTASDGRYRGMAPDADLTVYATDGGATLLQVVGAYDHLVEGQRRGRHDVQVVNNSYGATSGNNYSPFGALQLATWAAFEAGMTPVFSAGNASDHDTLNDYSIGPHVLSSAATDDERYVTGFSSKGRRDENYDGAADDDHLRGGPYEFPEYVNYDRAAALSNLEALYAKSDAFAGDPLITTTRSGSLGPAVSTIYAGHYGTGSVYEEWTAPESTADSDAGVGFVELVVSWLPPGQDIDVYLHEGSEDGPVVGFSAGSSTSNPDAETVRAPVSPGETYYVEIYPWQNVAAQYEVTIDGYEALAEQPSRPFGLHRPSVGTPGKFVMSTASLEDQSQVYPTVWYSQGAAIQLTEGEVPPSDLRRLRREQTEQADDPYYGQLSGTSMSGPVLAGLVALVYDAYRQTHPDDAWPDPIDVINTIEATATASIEAHPEDDRWAHRTYTIGAGFADAAAAVRVAEAVAAGDASFPTADDVVFADDLVFDGDDGDDPVVFDVDGSRTDFEDAVTAGQTLRVQVHVDATAPTTVRDRLPFGWTVLQGDHDRVETTDGERFVVFDDVPAAAEGAARTLTYYVEAPESTGRNRFGPAAAKPTGETAAFRAFTGSATVTVVGVDQNDVPL